jgi:hypothetical protein
VVVEFVADDGQAAVIDVHVDDLASPEGGTVDPEDVATVVAGSVWGRSYLRGDASWQTRTD